MIVLDANVVIAVLDADDALHADAVELLRRHEGSPFGMHEITMAEVLAGPAQLGREAADRVWASIVSLGVQPILTAATPLDVATLRAATGLPIPDCLVILAAGAPERGDLILTFDRRLAARARERGDAVEP